MGQIELVQLCQIVEKSVVAGIGQQLPVQGAAFVPFSEHAQLVAHKVQLFPRVGKHGQVQQPHLGKLVLLAVPVHLLQDGGLAVNHLVVGKRQQIPLFVKVVQREGQLFRVGQPLLGRSLKEGQGVVHPAQIPLVGKAQPALVHRRGDPRVLGGILRHQHRLGKAFSQSPV